jgi:polysaccharide transporter, PST family
LIKKLLSKTKNNEMINTSFYTSVGTIIGFITGFVVNKVIAVHIGPGGVAIISQFQNFIGISTTIASGGIQQGVVKYVAEVREDEKEMTLVLSTSLRISLFFSLLVGIFTFIFSDFLSIKLFNTQEYKYILFIFGFTVVLFGLNQLLMSILNGTGEIKKLVGVKIASNLFGLLVTSVCVYLFGISGALVALAISQSVIFFISFLFVLKSKWFKIYVFNQKLSKNYYLKLSGYSLMALTSLLLTPLVQIGIRNHIIETLSIEQAGYWDGLSKISTAYLGIITSSLSIYYLPKLSFLKERLEIRRELLNGYKIITPFLVVILLSVYLLKDYVIVILYSSEFMKMNSLFGPQLAGDFFKIMSWLIAYLMLAKALTKIFIVSQIVFLCASYLLSTYLISLTGLEGVVWAHCIIYLTYFISMIILFKNYLVK